MMKKLIIETILLTLCTFGCHSQVSESTLSDAFDQKFYSGSVAALAEGRDLMSKATLDSHGVWNINAEAKSGSLAWKISGRKLLHHSDVSSLNYTAGSLNASGYRSHTWAHGPIDRGSFSATAKLDLFGDTVPPSKKLKFNVRLNYAIKPDYSPSGPPDIVGVFPEGSIRIVCNYINIKGHVRSSIYVGATSQMYRTSDKLESDSVSLVTAPLDLTDCKSLHTKGRVFLELVMSGAQAIRFDNAEIQMLTEN